MDEKTSQPAIDQLTFDTAPPSGTGNIEVVVFSPLIMGAATDAVVVQYTPGGTGAVITNVQAKLREAVSVKDFGAVGDGVTDDTAAIQAAVNYAESVTYDAYIGAHPVVFFPSGKYLNLLILRSQHSHTAALLVGNFLEFHRLIFGR